MQVAEIEEKKEEKKNHERKEKIEPISPNYVYWEVVMRVLYIIELCHALGPVNAQNLLSFLWTLYDVKYNYCFCQVHFTKYAEDID